MGGVTGAAGLGGGAGVKGVGGVTGTIAPTTLITTVTRFPKASPLPFFICHLPVYVPFAAGGIRLTETSA
ncbi:MAG: hypothetical protein HY023_06965 [Chloroflexi bacterium]|nr:hypothetical protein [Chloroflexota bacterium]